MNPDDYITGTFDSNAPFNREDNEVEPTQELTLTESFESGHEHLFYQVLSERKLSLTEVANALIENDNGWGNILAKIIEKL